MRIIPAIDIIEGKCVRLSKGNYQTKIVYYDDPLEIAKKFEDIGIQYLHLVDLDGAKSKHIVNYKILESIAKETRLKIDFGGGIKTDEDIKIAFENGANQVTGGSIALSQPETFIRWLETYGHEKIILGADFINNSIATNGWLQTTQTDIIKYIKNYEQKGIRNVISTDISKDGMLKGPNLKIYESILKETRVNLIASGGISTINDIESLKKIGCEGAIIGKAIYENKISLNDLKTLLNTPNYT